MERKNALTNQMEYTFQMKHLRILSLLNPTGLLSGIWSSVMPCGDVHGKLTGCLLPEAPVDCFAFFVL